MRDSDEGRRITGAEPGPEVDEELAYHLDQRVREYERAGSSHEQARARALERLGDLKTVRDECTDLLAADRLALDRRQSLHFSLLDFKLGFRMLRRYPGLSVVGVLAMTFAIAIGAAAFEAITWVVRPRLPFPDGDRIVTIGNWTGYRPQFTGARDFVAWQEGLRSVRDLGAFRTFRLNLVTRDDDGAPIRLAQVSPQAFLVTGTTPLLGRSLVVADAAEGAPAVVVLGYDLWRSRLGGDERVVGRTVRLGSSSATVVGVMPRAFQFPVGQEAWAPLGRRWLEGGWGEGSELGVFGRLAPGVTLEQAQAEVSLLGARAAADSPSTHQQLQPLVRRYAESSLPIQCDMSWTRCISLTYATLVSSNLFFVLFLVLICANVALLMFARAATRESEIIVRNALGASRTRIVTQLVAEALVLGAVAALLGLPAATLALRTALNLLSLAGAADQIPPWWTASLSLPSVLYAVGLTVLGAVVAGALPALKLTRASGGRVNELSAGAGRLRLSGVWTPVIVLQIALTVIVVALGARMLQLTAGIAAFDPGFPAEEYLGVRLEKDEPIPVETYQELERRLSFEPGVRGVTFARALPGSGHARPTFEVEGGPAWSRVQSSAVDPAFFDAIEARIVAGRAFHPDETSSGAPVVVVNDAFVQEVLGGRNAIGQRIRFRATFDAAAQWGPWHDIVGVVEGVRMGTNPEAVGSSVENTRKLRNAGVYTPLMRGSDRSVALAVHHPEDPASFAPRLRQLGFAIDPALRMAVQQLDEITSQEARLYGVGMAVLSVASLIVLTISLATIYAVMSFVVSRRTREIGIRRALGARPSSIVGSVIARPLTQIALGVATGVGALVAFAYQDGSISQRFTLVIVTFTSTMFCVCMLACLVPTRRALRIEPTEALRSEG